MNDSGARAHTIDNLFWTPPPSEEEIRRRLQPVEQHLEARFQASADSFDRLRERQASLREALVPAGSSNEGLEASVRRAVEGRRQAGREAAQKAAAHVESLPSGSAARERIFSGSIGATRVPPYSWASAWRATRGDPMDDWGAANSTGHVNGHLDMNALSAIDRPSSIWLTAWAGTYVHPMMEESILVMNSNPSITYSYGDECVTDGASTNGWIGLFVQEYDSQGIPSGVPVAQQISLWSDASWWSGIGEQFGSTSGFPLSAVTPVKHSHSYGVFVWCGLSCFAAGWGNPMWGSDSSGALTVRIPSITWELI